VKSVLLPYSLSAVTIKMHIVRHNQQVHCDSCYCLSRFFLHCWYTRLVNYWVISWLLLHASVKSSLQQMWRRFSMNMASYPRRSSVHVLTKKTMLGRWNKRTREAGEIQPVMPANTASLKGNVRKTTRGAGCVYACQMCAWMLE